VAASTAGAPANSRSRSRSAARSTRPTASRVNTSALSRPWPSSCNALRALGCMYRRTAPESVAGRPARPAQPDRGDRSVYGVGSAHRAGAADAGAPAVGRRVPASQAAAGPQVPRCCRAPSSVGAPAGLGLVRSNCLHATDPDSRFAGQECDAHRICHAGGPVARLEGSGGRPRSRARQERDAGGQSEEHRDVYSDVGGRVAVATGVMVRPNRVPITAKA
jgi:hypothetical protein